MLVALRSSRVSYQLAPINNSTTTQGHETQNTTLFTNNISNIECLLNNYYFFIDKRGYP